MFTTTLINNVIIIITFLTPCCFEATALVAFFFLEGTMEYEQISKLIRNYITETFNTSEYLIYGSFSEYRSGYIVHPQDIDIIVTGSKIKVPDNYSVLISGVPIPLQINTMDKSDVFAEVESLEPKYLGIIYTPMCYGIYGVIADILDKKTKAEIRSAISSFSSKAYNKGKKKLITHDDYDEYLGLKNIYHAFKFVHNAMRRFTPFPHSDTQFVKDKDIMEMYDIKRLIFDTYYKSTGTLEERWKSLDTVIKPLYNTYMTQFRKVFPKEVSR